MIVVRVALGFPGIATKLAVLLLLAIKGKKWKSLDLICLLNTFYLYFRYLDGKLTPYIKRSKINLPRILNASKTNLTRISNV